MAFARPSRSSGNSQLDLQKGNKVSGQEGQKRYESKERQCLNTSNGRTRWVNRDGEGGWADLLSTKCLIQIWKNCDLKDTGCEWNIHECVFFLSQLAFPLILIISVRFSPTLMVSLIILYFRVKFKAWFGAWMNEWIIYIALYCVLLYTQSALQSRGGGGGGGSLLNHHQCAAYIWMMWRQPQHNGASALTTHQLQVEARERQSQSSGWDYYFNRISLNFRRVVLGAAWQNHGQYINGWAKFWIEELTAFHFNL